MAGVENEYVGEWYEENAVLGDDLPPPPPTFSPMSLTRNNLVYAGRTTMTDIMSVINTTSVFKKDKSQSPEKGSPFRANLPYKKSPSKLGAVLFADTQWTKLQLAKTQRERNSRLVMERNYFMNELHLERSDEEWHRHFSVVKIQALFRGFRCRPRSLEQREMQHKRMRVFNSVEEIRKELVAHARLLRLGAIKGLTLEPQDKESRRLRKIVFAASLRLQRFFKMLRARNKARRRLVERWTEIRNKMARRLVHFFKYVFMVSFTKKAEKVKRGAKAVVIQTQVRSFLARKQVRFLKKQRILRKRQNQSSTIITRNYGPYVRRVQEERERPIRSMADLLLDRYLFDKCYDDMLADMLTAESKIMYQGEIEKRVVAVVFESLSDEAVETLFDNEVALYIEEQIRILEEIRQKLEEERLALERERIRLKDEMERAEREEEERKRKDAEKLMKQAEVRRLAEKARLEAEKEAQRQAALREKARLYVESQQQQQSPAAGAVVGQAESHQQGQNVAKMLVAAMDEPAVESLEEDLDLHSGSQADRIERAKTLKRFCRYELCIEVLSKILVDLLREAAVNSGDAIEVKIGVYGERLLMLSEVSVWIGECHFALGDCKQAGEKFVYAEEIRERVVGRRHELVAEVEIALAKIYFQQGKFVEADAAFKEAHGILEQFEAPSDSNGSSTNVDTSSAFSRNLLCASFVGLAELHHSTGNYNLCEISTDSCFNFVEAHFVESDKARLEVMANCLDIQARMLATQGLIRESFAAHQEVLDLRLEFHGTEQHPEVASSMTHLGLVMLRMCNMADAKKSIDRGLEIRRSFFSDEHLCVANSHFALAKWHQATSSFRMAMSHMQHSYEIRLKSLGPDAHHLVAQSVLGMAEITREEGFPVAAQPIYEAALDMFRECYRSSTAADDETTPARHLRVARALYGMGVNLMECGKFARAAEAIQEAQTFRTLQLPRLDVEFHWEISAGNIALANCLMEMGRLEEAKTLLVAAGKTLLVVFGAQHILIAQGLLVLGRICFARGQFKDATKMFQNCLAQQTKILGCENQRLVSTYYAMVLNYLGPGDYDEAIEACNKCVEIVASALPPDEQQGSSTIGGLTAIFVLHARAQILRDTGTLEDAHVLLEQGLLYIRDFFGGSEDSTYFAVMLGELGECLRLQGKTSQAEAAIEESLRLRRQQFGDAHALIAEALRFKVLLMLDKGMPNEAADLLEDAVLPLLRDYFASQLASTDQHPAVVFANGVLGICLKAIHAKEFGLELESGQERESNLRDKLDYAQDMIDDALDFFDVYKQGSFNDLHPWILRLGGFASTINSAEHSRVSTAASARMTTASYSSLRVNSSALSSRPQTTTSSFSLVGALASRPPTGATVLPLTITIDEDDDRAGGDRSDSPEMRSTTFFSC